MSPSLVSPPAVAAGCPRPSCRPTVSDLSPAPGSGRPPADASLRPAFPPFAAAPPSSPTQDPGIDTFRLEYLLGPCAVLSLLITYQYSVTEVLWAFSIYLESVAILPQLFMLQRTGEAETITTHYLAALGIYRGLYIPNWIFRSVLPLPRVTLGWRAGPLTRTDRALFARQLLYRGHGRPDRRRRRPRPDRPLHRLLSVLALPLLRRTCRTSS